MIVCDECREVGAKAFDCFVVVEKIDDDKKRKPKPREVVKIPVALCDKCITEVCRQLGHLKQKGHLSGVKE